MGNWYIYQNWWKPEYIACIGEEEEEEEEAIADKKVFQSVVVP